MDTCQNLWNTNLSQVDSNNAPVEWYPTFYTATSCGAGGNGESIPLEVRNTWDPSATFSPNGDAQSATYWESPNSTETSYLHQLPNSDPGIGLKHGPPYAIGLINGANKNYINANDYLQSLIVPPNMTFQMWNDYNYGGNTTGELPGSYISNFSQDARTDTSTPNNTASSLKIKRIGSMSDWAHDCCMQNGSNSAFKNINSQTCGPWWGRTALCDNFMDTYCHNNTNAKNLDECRCILQNPDPPLPSDTDPRIISFMNQNPSCSQVCSGINSKYYKPSQLGNCNASLNLQITNCTQNTDIPGASNIVSNPNIQLVCNPQQTNKTVIVPSPPPPSPATNNSSVTNQAQVSGAGSASSNTNTSSGSLPSISSPPPSPANAATSPQTATTPATNYTTYIIIAIAAAVLLGGGYFYFRKSDVSYNKYAQQYPQQYPQQAYQQYAQQYPQQAYQQYPQQAYQQYPQQQYAQQYPQQQYAQQYPQQQYPQQYPQQYQ